MLPLSWGATGCPAPHGTRVPLGELAALASALTWALNSALLRWLATHANVVMLNALRCSIAFVLMLGVVLVAGRGPELLTLPSLPLALLVASVLVGIGLGDSLYFHAIRLVGLARAQPVSASYPLVTALLSALFLDERLSPQALLGIAAIVGGVSVVATAQARPSRAASGARRGWRLLPSDPVQRLGISLALAAALCWAVGTALLRPALESIDVWLATVVRLGCAALVLQLWSLRHLPAVGRSARASRPFTVGVLALGVGTGVSLTLFLVGVAEAGAARAAALTSASPLFGVPLAALVLHEQVTWRLLAGALLTLVGVWLVVLR